MERSMTAAGITIKAAPLSRRFLQPEKCGAYGTHAIRSKTPMHPQISAAMPEITNNANIKSSFLGAAFLNIIMNIPELSMNGGGFAWAKVPWYSKHLKSVTGNVISKSHVHVTPWNKNITRTIWWFWEINFASVKRGKSTYIKVPCKKENTFGYFYFVPGQKPTANPAERIAVGKEEQRNECALTFEKSRSKRYAACSDVEVTPGFESSKPGFIWF